LEVDRVDKVDGVDKVFGLMLSLSGSKYKLLSF